MSAIAFSRAIGPVPIDVVIREKHSADLSITQVPVEAGADITDHAFREPSSISLDIIGENGPATWAALEAFQVSRLPFTFVSGLKVYTSMLIEHMEAERDRQWSAVFYGRVDLKEVIIVSTATAASEGGADRQHGQAGGKKSTRARRPSAATSKSTTAKQRSAGRVSRGGGVATSRPTPSNPTVPSTPSTGTPARNGSILSSVFG